MSAEQPSSGVRLLALWCPDWPVVAATLAVGIRTDAPAAVVSANRVVACSAAARRHGVRRGARRREAQSLCPELVVLDNDPGRDGRMFEPVAAAVEELTPGIEVVRPGVLVVPVRGPALVFCGESEAAERVVEHVATEVGVECQVGVSEGVFAASVAARRGVLVPRGGAADLLAPLGIAELVTPLEPVPTATGKSRADLVDLLWRLGIRTLGSFAALPEQDVCSRFGADAVVLHRLASGTRYRPPARRSVPPELLVEQEFDPVLDRVDAATFAARGLAERFHAGLARHGLACVRLRVRAHTDNGEELSRVWRCADPLTEDGIADRVRWQLEGWLRSVDAAPTAGVSTIALEPVETVGGESLQLGLWQGAETDRISTERAGRALVRVQGLLGPRGAYTPVLRGGRGPGERVRLVCWGDERVPDTDPALPWPGKLPAPSPATMPVEKLPVALFDERGAPVAVDGNRKLTGRPHRLVLDGASALVHDWGGPWVMDCRWWSRADATRVARIQVLCSGLDAHRGVGPGGHDGAGHGRHGGGSGGHRGADHGDHGGGGAQRGLLLLQRSAQWTVEGVYD